MRAEDHKDEDATRPERSAQWRVTYLVIIDGADQATVALGCT